MISQERRNGSFHSFTRIFLFFIESANNDITNWNRQILWNFMGIPALGTGGTEWRLQHPSFPFARWQYCIVRRFLKKVRSRGECFRSKRLVISLEGISISRIELNHLSAFLEGFATVLLREMTASPEILLIPAMTLAWIEDDSPELRTRRTFLIFDYPD